MSIGNRYIISLQTFDTETSGAEVDDDESLSSKAFCLLPLPQMSTPGSRRCVAQEVSVASCSQENTLSVLQQVLLYSSFFSFLYVNLFVFRKIMLELHKVYLYSRLHFLVRLLLL
jgi:hypothetical protein